MTLALARLIAGHEMSVEPGDRLGPDRAELAIVSALFHDVGYLRHRERDARGRQRRRVHARARDAQRPLPRAVLAAHRPRAVRARRRAHRAFHGLRAQRRSDRARGAEGQRRRPLARHGRSRRAARRPLLSREVPRPPLPRVRARRRRDRRSRRRQGALPLGRGLARQDAVVLPDVGALAAREQLQPRLSLLRGVLRARPQPLHPLHPQEPDVLEHRHSERRLGPVAQAPALHHAGPAWRSAPDGARACSACAIGAPTRSAASSLAATG